MDSSTSLITSTQEIIIKYLVQGFILELIATLMGFLFILFLIKENKIAWIYGFFSSLIMTFIYFNQHVYMQSILYAYYTFMSVYGFLKWSNNTINGRKKLIISEYSLRTHFIFIFITCMMSGLLGLFLLSIIKSSYSHLDAFIFTFSILATYLQVNKIVSNWIYWIIINITSVILLLYLSLYLFSILIFVYVIFSIIGYVRWKKELKKYRA